MGRSGGDRGEDGGRHDSMYRVFRREGSSVSGGANERGMLERQMRL